MSAHGPAVGRRVLVQGVAGAAALVALGACGGDGDGPGPGGSAGAGGSPGDIVAALADVPVGGGVVTSAAVVTRPAEGEVRGFSSTCTHQSCRLSSVDVDSRSIVCACHGSQFSIDDGSVITGPATEPLPEVAVRVEGGDVVLA